MDRLIRIERFIRSQGTNSAPIWTAWFDIKQILKRSKDYAELSDNKDCAVTVDEQPSPKSSGDDFAQS